MNIYQEHRREANILTFASDHPIMKIATHYGGFLAGGAIRSVFASEKISDFDIFFPDSNSFNLCVSDISAREDSTHHNLYPFVQTDSAWSFITDRKQHFQLICAVYGTPNEVLNNFDFTVCMGAWTTNTKEFLMSEHFLKHIAQRRLCFNVNAQYPICSLWRSIKYAKRGYKLPAIDAIKLALAIHNIRIDTHADLKKQLMGIDTMFLQELTGKLGDLTPHARYDFGEAIEMIGSFIDDKESENLD